MNSEFDTFPKLFLRNVRRYGSGKIAYREKDMGIWLSSNWQEMYESVKSLAAGFADLGLMRGDTVAFMGDNRPEYLWGMLAAQALGAKTVGIYQDALANEVQHVMNHSDVKIALVEDQEQTDKLLDIHDRLPALKKLVVDDWKGLKSYKDPLLVKLTDVQQLGRERVKSNPVFFEEETAKGKGGDIAIICYTSGTTGVPKGAMLSYSNIIRMAESLEKVIAMDERDSVVTYLPLAWIVEMMISVGWYLRNGFTINFPERPETVQENIREIGPTILVSPPRIWEKMCSEVQVKMMDSTWIKRQAYRLCYKKGQEALDRTLEKRRPSVWEQCTDQLNYHLVFRALQDRLGLLRIKHAFTGGAALGPDVFRFFQAFGLNIKQMYGQTEMGGIIATHLDGDVDYETVGKAIPDVDLKISDIGEILCKGPGMFAGYYKNPEATRAIVDGEGYLHTGDFGYINQNGHLVVIDRMKDVIKLSEGSNFSPTFIENRLKFSPYIREAIAVGKDRPFVAGLIQIDYSFVGDWAEKRQIAYTTFADLARKKEVKDLIQKEVNRVNMNLPEPARIRKFLLLEKELDADDDELTRTQKLRRSYVSEKYKDLINDLYREKEA